MVKYAAIFSLLMMTVLNKAYPQKKHSPGSQFPSYKGLVLAGYQGWFNTPDDGAGRGWTHYVAHGEFGPGNCKVDLWPDVSEYKKNYPSPFKKADGTPACLFSSYDAATTDLHFKWMEQYGIDGVFVQRFIGSTRGGKVLAHNDKVMEQALNGSRKYQRAIAVMYDLSGMKDDDKDPETVINDWKHLVDDLKLTSGGARQTYLYHNGKPLVAVWGVGFPGRSYGLKGAEKILDFLKNDPVYGGCSVLLGVPTYWRDFGNDAVKDPHFHDLLRKADIIQPWMVGRYNETSYAKFPDRIKEDIAWCKQNHVDYVPVVFPGFSWHNMYPASPQDQIPRNRGHFYWEQITGAINSGAEMLYVAMFDEIDEGTAIFKVSKDPPAGASNFVKFESDIPSDYYLFLTGYATKMLRKELPFQQEVPLPPSGAGKGQQTRFARDFAPSPDFVKLPERPYRDGICLNGSWSFFPVENAEKLSKGMILHPELPFGPGATGRLSPDPVPIKIPSPWNVNSFARGNGSGGDFVTYPSYPKNWENIKAGWLQRKIPYRKEWKGKRLILHFEAVDGYTQVFVNGKHAGENRDIFLPFEIDITNLLKEGPDNELWVWVADAALLNQPGKYGRRTYVAGSFWGQHARGIWQDVNLLVKPAVSIETTFIKPELDKDTLSVEITLANTTGQATELTVSGTLSPWINKAGKTIAEAPEPIGESGTGVLSIPGVKIKIAPQSRTSLTLRVKAGNKLTPWTPERPTLYGLLLTAEAQPLNQRGESGQPQENSIDKKYTRFGWRQFTINGNRFCLNGQPIRLKGDSWHFMGIPQMTRRYAWAWFSALKDCHANAVRLHAQPYPEFYLDMADEMGICVLDETGIWASDGGPKVDAEEYWTNCNAHVERLVLRDRNHPSVFGWSICNENLAVVMGVQHAPDSLVQRQVAQINKWVAIARRTDPTRPWISGDGETNLPTDLPVVIGHYGGTDSYKAWSSQGKVWGIGEGGMAYYGTPRQTAVYNGSRSYESQLGRMEGVAKEASRLLALQKSYGATYSSVFNIAWYALKPLELGMKDSTKAPSPSDGIFFNPYQESHPGIQPERLGPYTTTFNPGYDPSLPLYRTWPLADSIRAAFSDSVSGTAAPLGAGSVPSTTPAGPAAANASPSFTPPSPTSYIMLLSSDKDSLLSRLLSEMGIAVRGTPVGKDLRKGLAPDKGRPLLIIDGLHAPKAQRYSSLQRAILETGGAVLIWGMDPESAGRVNEYLPRPLELTTRKATSFLVKAPDPMLNGLGNAEFYFSELSDTPLMNYGLSGDFTHHGTVLLEAANTDWKTWNGRAEYLKTAAVLRSEREYKPEGAALVSEKAGKGEIYVLALDPAVLSKTSVGFLRKLFINLGVSFQNTGRNNTPAIDQQGKLQQALLLASFDITGKSNEEIRAIDLLKDSTEGLFFPGRRMNDRYWEKATARDGMFDFTKLSFAGPSQNAMAYLSFWLYSPRSLSNLLIEPDMPRVDLYIGADDACQVYLNRKLIHESFAGGYSGKGDLVRAIPLEKGWNHVLIKAIQKGGAWKLALELDCDKKEFLNEIKSQIAR